jgi:hypothetical protein
MRGSLLFALMAAVVLSGCSKGATSESPIDEPAQDPDSVSARFDGPLRLDAIELTAPAEWRRVPAASSVLAAEFILPRGEGDQEDGRLTISTAGGSVEANIDRWKSQFKPAPQDASQEEITAGGLKVTIVDLSGTFNDQRGPFAPATPRPNFRMIGAVIPVDGQSHFIKATGPKSTIAHQEEAIRQFIRSVRPTK